MTKKTILTSLIASVFVAGKSIAMPTPDAVEPQFDENDDPTYYVTYGEGDRLDPSMEKPLNLIQIYCKEQAVDFASDEDMDECRANADLVEMKYGWMDFLDLQKVGGAYHAECHVCHGPDAMGVPTHHH